MRLIHTADLHLGLRRYGFDRTDDFAFTLSAFVRAAKEHEADVAIFAGDTFNSRTPGPRELAAFSGAVAHLRREDIAVIVAPGNHDGAARIADPSSHTLKWMRQLQLPGVLVFTDPGVARISTRSGPLLVAGVPYPHKRAFDLSHGDLPKEERILQVGAAVESLIGTYAEERQSDVPFVFVGHFSVAGAMLGSEQAMRMDWDVTVRADALLSFDYAALGHIHRQQQVNEKAWYAGSPDYHIFEDWPQRKGFVLAEVQPLVAPTAIVIEHVGRPLVTQTLNQNEDGTFEPLRFPDWLKYHVNPMVRLRLACRQRPTAEQVAFFRRHLLQEMRAPFVQVLVELEQQETHARVDVPVGISDEEALELYLRAHDLPIEPTLTVGRQLIAEAMTPAA